MNKLNAILLVIVVLSAWSVVTSTHVSRKLYSDLQKERKSVQQLEIEFGQLQLEQSTWGAHAVIEKAASSRLDMHTPDPRQIQVVSPGKGK
ncbi:cell division protein FtsL [Chromobacterium haemolyticum]|uniref:cell division protein FtsL n=1 Tax=Chromobacterium haemolyticum TaxID=394935 RepID=UPI0009D9B5FB|nr:cell division protein FtsL [Chromobacterium haemolyticum]OQS40068.1 cell division protein FtsL [Chromobacterium haemolyticum]